MYGHGISREATCSISGRTRTSSRRAAPGSASAASGSARGASRQRPSSGSTPRCCSRWRASCSRSSGFAAARWPSSLSPTRWPRRRDVPGPGADRGGRPALPLSTPERASAASANRATLAGRTPRAETAHRQALARAAPRRGAAPPRSRPGPRAAPRRRARRPCVARRPRARGEPSRREVAPAQHHLAVPGGRAEACASAEDMFLDEVRAHVGLALDRRAAR